MKGQVVLITGSSSGIGRETAYRFAEAGAKLVLTYYRGKARGEAAERRCLRLGAADTLLGGGIAGHSSNYKFQIHTIGFSR